MKSLNFLIPAVLLAAGCASSSSQVVVAKPGESKTVKTKNGEITITSAGGPAKAGTLGSVDSEGFKLIFDGTWTGWRVSENPQAWSIVNGAFRANGSRSHNFYIGDPVPFKDFELKVDVMTEKNSNGGIYVLTKFQDEGWPKYGFETQVNVSHGDWKKTGSIYDVVNVKETPAKDYQWWTQHVIVKGKHISVRIDGKSVVEYDEPADKKPGADFPRMIDAGTVALQAHDPGSVVLYKNIRVKRL